MSDPVSPSEPCGGLPRLNEPLPPFRARTTHGERTLEYYRGRWLLLMSHPADFTPVCASEFIAFARAYPRFRALGCELLALSVDSIFAHVAWCRSLRERFGVEVPFPIIEDVSMSIARAYGMIHPKACNTAAVRACFVICPEGVLRALLYYPVNVGRNVEEILRLVRAIQETEARPVSTPENWVPGEAVLLATPVTTAEADARATQTDSRDWYFALDRSKSP